MTSLELLLRYALPTSTSTFGLLKLPIVSSQVQTQDRRNVCQIPAPLLEQVTGSPTGTPVVLGVSDCGSAPGAGHWVTHCHTCGARCIRMWPCSWRWDHLLLYTSGSRMTNSHTSSTKTLSCLSALNPLHLTLQMWRDASKLYLYLPS